MIIIKHLKNINSRLIQSHANTILSRYSSFLTSEKVRPLEEYPEVEIVRNPPEWKYVERLLPSAIVPQPRKKAEYPSGWKPPSIDLQNVNNLTYYVSRTRNHMLPVYLETTFRGQRRITLIKYVQGDIYTLQNELQEMLLKARNGKHFATRVNEMSRQLRIHGDHVDLVKDYLKSKGF